MHIIILKIISGYFSIERNSMTEEVILTWENVFYKLDKMMEIDQKNKTQWKEYIRIT